MSKFKQTEEDVKKLVKEWYAARQAWSYAPIQTGMGVHGIPDRIGCVPIVVTQEMVGVTVGLFVAVEAKKPGRRGEKNTGASPAQVAQLHAITDAHGIAALVDGTNDLDWLTESINFQRGHNDLAGFTLTRRLNNG